MKSITVDCASIQTPRQLHEALAAALSLPAWYGSNLDALYDCLTDLRHGLSLTLENWPQEQPWAAGFTDVLTDVARDNPHFSFSVLC